MLAAKRIIKFLDLCCKAGGAAGGYYQAAQALGYEIEITGVDKEPQKNYPYKFIQADAIEYLRDHGHEYDFVHGSPPCQKHSQSTAFRRNTGTEYPCIIQPMRELMEKLTVPCVIENVKGAPIRKDLMLRGDLFGLKVIRVRAFELINWTMETPVLPKLVGSATKGDYVTVYGKAKWNNSNWSNKSIRSKPTWALPTVRATWAMAMGIDWHMKDTELAEAIPPAYTKYIGLEMFEKHLPACTTKSNGAISRIEVQSPVTTSEITVPPGSTIESNGAIRKVFDSYPGGKSASGAPQAIINEVPVHQRYYELFVGGGSIYRQMLPAPQFSVLADLDTNVIDKWRNAPLSNTIVVRENAIDILRSLLGSEYDNANTFVYLDPPYPLFSRSSQRPLYKFEMTDFEHMLLLDIIVKLKCNIAISTYANQLYADRLKGWRLKTFKLKTRHSTATEYLYMNYPAPDALHDYRYLGDDYRIRERIKNKTTRTIKKIEKLPALERLALLSAIKQSFAI